MRKRYHNFSQNDGVRKIAGIKGQSKILRPTKPKKNKVKFLFLFLLLVFLGIIAYVGMNSLSAANNIMDTNIKLSDLVKKSSLKEADGITNILVLGKGGENHPGGQLTDTIMILRMRQQDNSVAMISVPRDLLVQIPGDGKSKINEAYTTGWNAEKDKDKRAEAGANLASQVIEKVSGLQIHYYLSVDFIGFKDLVDSLGGITVDVDQDLSDPLYPKDSFTKNGYVKTEAYAPLYVKKGIQEMDGVLALKYARSRETTSDFDRAKRQQKVIFAIKEKMLTLGVLANPQKVSSVMESLGSHIRTNLTLPEIKELFQKSQKIEKDKVINKVIDNNQKDGLLVSSSEGFYHLEPKSGNFNEIQRVIKNIFEVNSAADENFSIEVYNGTDTSGLAKDFADDLKIEGFNVTKIETNKDKIDVTEIYSAGSGSKTLEKIKSKLKNPKMNTMTDKGVIKIIIGKEYGN